MRLDRYMKENIFEPLGMADTGFKISPAMRPRKAAVHIRKEGGGFTATDHELDQKPEVFMGGGALYSTIGDYLRFTRMILGHGTLDGVQVLKPATVALMSLNSMGEGLVPAAQEPAAQPQHRHGLRRRHEVGPHLHDQSHGVPRPALGRQPDLGRARQLLLLDRPGEEGDRRVGAPSCCRSTTRARWRRSRTSSGRSTPAI